MSASLEMPWGDWPLHKNEDGDIECPRCLSTDVVDLNEPLTDEQLESMHISSAPGYYECNDCGNKFIPVDALEHSERTHEVSL